MRILLIEDDEPIIRAMTVMLGKTTLPICVARTKNQARTLFYEHDDFCVILCDGWLKNETSDTCDLIKEMRTTFHGPMIAMSSCSDTRARQVIAGCDESARTRLEAVKIAQLVCEDIQPTNIAA